jgi:hypothetical protein
LVASIFLTCVIKIALLPWPGLLPEPSDRGWTTWAGSFGGDGFERAQTLKELGPRRLIFVRYAESHNIHDEWVYNDADIQNAPIVLARDMGRESNRCVIEAFPSREVGLLQPDFVPPRYTPYAKP